MSHRVGILITMTLIIHRDDACVEAVAQSVDGLLKVRREGGDPASSRKRIAYQRDALQRRHMTRPPASKQTRRRARRRQSVLMCCRDRIPSHKCASRA